MESNCESVHAVVAMALFITMFALMWYKKGRGLHLSLEPYYNRDKQHTNYIATIIHGYDEISTSMLRMNKTSIFGLCDLLKAKRLLCNTLHVSIKKQVAMFLHNVRNRVIRVKFLRYGETVS